MSDCVFCDIVAGESPGSFVYHDDATVAFMDLYPINPGQVLVIPRKHAPYMGDLDEETGGKLFQTTMRICKAIRHSNVKCEGINLFLADGEVAHQEIFHVHFIIIPRFKGDYFKINCSQGNPSRPELNDIAASIQASYQALY
jgi:diadenosine tetraphosphate (Ap4A) HIT family hydrolase